MKKVVSLVLALVLAAAVSAPAFAATETVESTELTTAKTAISVAGVKTTASVSPAANTQTTIKFPQSKACIVKGKKLTVPAMGYDATGKSVKITYSSNKKDIATVSSKGVITAKKKGTAKITATGKGVKKAVLTVKVVGSKSKSYGWDKYSIPTQMYVGTVKYASATPWPSTATGIVIKYSSSNKAVATVDTSGRITARSPGNTRISVKVGSSTVYRNMDVGHAPVTKNQTVVDQSNVKIVVTKLEYTQGGGVMKMYYTVTNNSGVAIRVDARNLVLNGNKALDCSCYNSYYYIQSGTTFVDYIYMASSDLKMSGITKISKMKFDFIVTTGTYYDTHDHLFRKNNITVSF